MRALVYPYIFIDRRSRKWANRSRVVSMTIYFGKSPMLTTPRQDAEYNPPNNYDLHAWNVAFAKAIADKWLDSSWVDAPDRPCPDCEKARNSLIVTFRADELTQKFREAIKKAGLG